MPLLKIAECDYNAGRLKDAIEDFQNFAVKYPKSSHLCEVNFNIAESFYYLDNLIPLLGYYQKVLDSSCDDDLACGVYGRRMELYQIK